jgi:hypothetical protein
MLENVLGSASEPERRMLHAGRLRSYLEERNMRGLYLNSDQTEYTSLTTITILLQLKCIHKQVERIIIPFITILCPFRTLTWLLQ